MQKQPICPCGSEQDLNNCCQPLISKQQFAKSPNALMRSRYTAYALSNFQYIYETYAKEKRAQLSIKNLSESAENTDWVKLIIHDSPDPEPASGIVEFSAFYLDSDSLFEMRERSNFIKEEDEWRYLDGDIICHEKVAAVKRNDPCPCGSNKKFKKCCSK